MDLTALRVERIRQDFEAAKFTIELRSREHLAVLAVALTVGASAVVAGLAGELGLPSVGGLVTASGATAVLQARALRSLSSQWEVVSAEAAAATDRLMPSEGEPSHDEQATDA